VPKTRQKYRNWDGGLGGWWRYFLLLLLSLFRPWWAGGGWGGSELVLGRMPLKRRCGLLSLVALLTFNFPLITSGGSS